MKFTISFPPLSGNHYKSPRLFHKRLHWYTHPAFQRWMDEVFLQTPPMKFAERKTGDKWQRDIILEVYVWAPQKRSFDFTNLWKVCEDAIARAWGINDSRFLPRAMAWAIDAENPRVEIEVKSFE